MTVALQSMATLVTNGIAVTVLSRFEAAHSDPRAGRFLHSYRVTIVNQGHVAVKLQRRHWIINDSMFSVREVEGPGVVGETPVIEPGGRYTYGSSCDLRSSLGRMEGSYLMQRVDDGTYFKVTIPEFMLHHPPILN